MSDTNPYSIHGQEVAAQAAPDARAAFLQRTYGWLAIGVVLWCLTMGAVPHVPVLESMAIGLYSKWWLCLAFLIGGAMLVRATAEKRPLGPVIYLAYAFGFGLFTAPLVMYATTFHPGVVTMAAVSTATIFTALTAYVFISGKDFSFMGGALSLISGLIFATLLLGWIFGFSFGGLWMPIVIAVLYSAYILYDTSQILHHYATNMHISAAANLFANVVLLFYNLVMIFMHSDD